MICINTLALLCLYRAGHSEATHIDNSVAGSASKHRAVPSGCSGIIDMFGTPHLELEHLPTVFPSMHVTHDCNAVWEVPSYIQEDAEGDNSNRRSEYISTVKYNGTPKILSYSNESQNVHYCKSGISDLFPRRQRQPQPSAKGSVEQNRNVTKIADRKADVSYFMDSSPCSILFESKKPIPPYIANYKHNVMDLLDEKENIGELYSLLGENKHEPSSNRRPVISYIKDRAVHLCQNIKLKPKPYINTVKDDNMDICNEVCESSAPQPPALRQHPTPLVSEQLPLQPNAAILLSHHHTRERQNCQQPVLPHIHETGSPLRGNTTKLQGLFSATRCHETSSSSSEHEHLPVLKKLNEMQGNGDITIPEDKFIWKSILDPMAGTGLKIKFVREKVKGGMDSTGSTSKSTPCKEKDKDHHEEEKAASLAPSNIVPKDNFICMSASEPLAGIGQKIEIQIEKPRGHSDSAGKEGQSVSGEGLKIKDSEEVCCSFSNTTGAAGCSIEIPSTSRKQDDNNLQLSQLVPPPGLPARTPVQKQPRGKKPSTCSTQTRLKPIRRALLPRIPLRKARGGGKLCKGKNSTAQKCKQELKSHLPASCYYRGGSKQEFEYILSPVLISVQGKLIESKKYVLRRSGLFGRLPQPVPY
jgi:hypothetical protein